MYRLFSFLDRNSINKFLVKVIKLYDFTYCYLVATVCKVLHHVHLFCHHILTSSISVRSRFFVGVRALLQSRLHNTTRSDRMETKSENNQLDRN